MQSVQAELKPQALRTPENAAGHRMPSETAASTPQPAKPVAATSRPVAASKRAEDYPCKFHYSVSIPMAESLARLSRLPAKLIHGREVDIGRRSLHQYLMTHDPHYARVVTGNGNAA